MINKKFLKQANKSFDFFMREKKIQLSVFKELT